MTVDNPRLMAILSIGHDTSIRGEGLSLRDALARTEYSALRAELGPAELVPLLRANPEFISQWLMYCEDKRTSGRFWVDETTLRIGSLEAPNSTSRYDSIEGVMAHYVVRELDFWSDVGDRQIRRCT